MAKRRGSDDEGRDARIEIKPRSPLTHQELLIDFIDLEPNVEFSVNVRGPNPQPYWASFRAGPDGRAQLFWRTQAPGEYTVSAKGDGVDLSETFTVSRQAGELYEDEVLDADVKTVEEPGRMGDTPSGEMRADPYDAELERPTQVDPAYEPAQPISTSEGPSPKPEARSKSAKARKGDR